MWGAGVGLEIPSIGGDSVRHRSFGWSYVVVFGRIKNTEQSQFRLELPKYVFLHSLMSHTRVLVLAFIAGDADRICRTSYKFGDDA